MLIDFQDAVTASNLDPNQKYAVYYMDGRFANRDAVAHQCPHAKLFGITVRGMTGPDVFAADSETGDMTVASTLAWVEKQIQLGVDLIVVYANLSRWLNEGLLAGVQALERKHGVKVRKWLAHYTGKRALEFPWVDAEQYDDPGPVDLNIALASFFGDTDPHYDRFDDRPRKVFNRLRRERYQVELYDRLRAMQTKTKHPRRAQLNFVRLVLAWYARRLTSVMNRQGIGPASEWRVWRRNQVVRRAQGERLV